MAWSTEAIISSDLLGFPKNDQVRFSKDLGGSGQARVLGARGLMPDFLRWSRVDPFVATPGTIGVYLPFDVPPLTPGSIIRARIFGSGAAAADQVGIGVARDWVIVPPFGVTHAVEFTIGTSGNVTVDFMIAVRGRNSLVSSVTAGNLGGGGGVITTIDCGISQRWALYTDTAAGAMTVNYALVEVFLTRLY